MNGFTLELIDSLHLIQLQSMHCNSAPDAEGTTQLIDTRLIRRPGMRGRRNKHSQAEAEAERHPLLTVY